MTTGPQQPPDGKKAVNIEQAAYLLSVHPQTIRKLIKEGQLRTTRVGKRHLISIAEIDRFLA